MQAFDLPSVLHEVPRQPVEQFGMRGLPTLEPEVARRIDDPAAKVVMPDAVNHNPRGQWVYRAGDPAGQLQPPLGARFRGQLGRQDFNCGNCSRRYQLAARAHVAALQHVHRWLSSAITNRVGGGQGRDRIALLAQGVDFTLQLVIEFALRDRERGEHFLVRLLARGDVGTPGGVADALPIVRV